MRIFSVTVAILELTACSSQPKPEPKKPAERCCQSNRNASPIDAPIPELSLVQALSDCHCKPTLRTVSVTASP